MKPLNFIPQKTSAYHLWSLYLWQRKYEKAVEFALEVMGGTFAFWSKKKGPLFAKTLAVVQHDRTLMLVKEEPQLLSNKRPVVNNPKPNSGLDFSFPIDVKSDRAAALVVTP